MKTPPPILKVFAIIFMATLALSACANKSDNSNRAAGRGANGPSGSDVAASSTCSNSSMEWGKIYDAQYPQSFESQVKGFVSATIDPNTLGRIEGGINSRTGVDLYAHFKFDNGGKLIPDESKMVMKIFDSYVGDTFTNDKGETKVIEPYVVEFGSATEGFFERSTGNIQVTFKDSYGTITFRGQQSGTTVQGVVVYVNLATVAGGTPASGKLGDFISYSCSMIK